MTGHKVGLITYVQIFGDQHPEIWEGEKVENSAPFQTTFDFNLIFLRNRSRYQKLEANLIDIDPCWVQPKIFVELCPLTKKLQEWLLTYFKLTMRVLRMLMHWSSGHVTLLWGNFSPLNFPPNWTYGAGWTHVGFSPNF